jgi:hypothetical protein
MVTINDVNGGWYGKTPNGSEALDGTYFYNMKPQL